MIVSTTALASTRCLGLFAATAQPAQMIAPKSTGTDNTQNARATIGMVSRVSSDEIASSRPDNASSSKITYVSLCNLSYVRFIPSRPYGEIPGQSRSNPPMVLDWMPYITVSILC